MRGIGGGLEIFSVLVNRLLHEFLGDTVDVPIPKSTKASFNVPIASTLLPTERTGIPSLPSASVPIATKHITLEHIPRTKPSNTSWHLFLPCTSLQLPLTLQDTGTIQRLNQS